PAFHEAAEDLRNQGWVIFSPAEHDESLGAVPPKDGAGDFEMRNSCLAWDFARIAEADCLIVLPGWETSTGVHWEMVVAYALGKPIYSYPSLDDIDPPDVVKFPTAPATLAAKDFHEVR